VHMHTSKGENGQENTQQMRSETVSPLPKKPTGMELIS
jgi:hypothetical protein